MRYRFGYMRFEGTPYPAVRVDYFRDDAGRCICVRNARLQIPSGVLVGEPAVVFDGIEIHATGVTPAQRAQIHEQAAAAMRRLNWEEHRPIVAVKP